MYYVSGVNRANFVRCRSKLNKEKRRARAKAIFEFEKGQRKSETKTILESGKKENKSKSESV